ncbi:MAG: AraC family transcriptional regulator [Prevotella sp.]|nr:AraC family transcriptional regulator [Prevotella sp.]
MKRIVIKLLTLFLVLFATVAEASHQPVYYHRWSKLSTEELLKLGYRYLQENHSDSALACFNMADQRYNDSMDKNEKMVCARSYMATWGVLLLYNYDYSKAYVAIQKAKDICDETGEELPSLYMNIGLMHQTYADQSGDAQYSVKSYRAFRRSFYKSIEYKDTLTLHMAFTNLAHIASEVVCMDSIDREWRIYNSFRFKSDLHFVKYNKMFYKGLMLIKLKEYAKAAQYLDEAVHAMTDTTALGMRWKSLAMAEEAEVFALDGRYDNAIKLVKSMLYLAQKAGLREVKLEAYRTLARYYNDSGQKNKSVEYHSQYLMLKDSLLNFQQMNIVGEVKLLEEIKQADELIARSEQRRNTALAVASVLFLIISIVALFAYMLLKKNKKLKASNEMLYRKSVETLKSEQHERQMVAEHRRLVRNLRIQLGKSNETIRLLKYGIDEKQVYPDREIETVDINGDGLSSRRIKGIAKAYYASQETVSKYSKSNLNEDNSRILLERIENIMEQADIICSPDFTIGKLAELVNSNHTYVSQVINASTGNNFSVYIGERRIREACRRINSDSRFQLLTIEAMATESGFRSRTSFISAFKRFVGLTPSEYIRMARKQTDNLS